MKWLKKKDLYSGLPLKKDMNEYLPQNHEEKMRRVRTGPTLGETIVALGLTAAMFVGAARVYRTLNPEPTCTIRTAVVQDTAGKRTMYDLSGGMACLEATRALNPNVNPGRLVPGQEIRVARPDPEGASLSDLLRGIKVLNGTYR